MSHSTKRAQYNFSNALSLGTGINNNELHCFSLVANATVSNINNGCITPRKSKFASFSLRPCPSVATYCTGMESSDWIGRGFGVLVASNQLTSKYAVLVSDQIVLVANKQGPTSKENVFDTKPTMVSIGGAHLLGSDRLQSGAGQNSDGSNSRAQLINHGMQYGLAAIITSAQCQFQSISIVYLPSLHTAHRSNH